jgi:hypothetical protein
LPPVGRLADELHNLVVAVEVPNFNLGGGTHSPSMRSIPDEREIARSTARWTATRSALIDDPDCNFLAVLDQPAEPIAAIGSSPPGVVRGINPLAGNVGDGVPIGSFGLPWNPLGN